MPSNPKQKCYGYGHATFMENPGAICASCLKSAGEHKPLTELGKLYPFLEEGAKNRGDTVKLCTRDNVVVHTYTGSKVGAAAICQQWWNQYHG